MSDVYGWAGWPPRPVQPQPTMPVFTPPAINWPQVPRTQTGQPGADIVPLNLPELPAPPQLPLPPTMRGGGQPNFGQVNQWLDKATPTDSGHLTAILGGFAQGAAQQGSGVPTFSQMLAQIGAGGGRGFQQSSGERGDFFKHRAGVAMDQTKLQQQASQEGARIANESARMQYEATIKNQLLQYEHQLKKHELAMPKVQLTAQGLLVQQPDAQTGRMSVQFHPTKPQLTQLEKINDLTKALGVPGPMGESLAVRMVTDMYKDDPVVGRGVMHQLAVQQTINRGLGQTVFGPVFDEARKQASRQLSQENPTLASRPQEFQRELNNRIAGFVMAHPRIMEGQWIPKAAQNGIAAAYALSGGQTPPVIPGRDRRPRPTAMEDFGARPAGRY